MSEKPVTIIVTGRNSATTIRQCLESFASQDYPIDRILVFDNDSSDGSQEIVRAVAKTAQVPVELVDGGANGCICTSYNRGAKMSTAEVIVITHSDAVIPMPHELRKLVEPLFADPDAVAAYPRNLMPRSVWDRFPFWEKFQFVRAVDATAHSNNAIFDAIRRDAYLKAGGFDEKRFTTTCGFGGEDSDAALRISRLGKTLRTEACAVHAHGFPKAYPFSAYAANRALMGRTYGKIIQRQGGLCVASDGLLVVRPILALLPFFACLFFFAGMVTGLCAVGVTLALQLAFAILQSRKMFTSRLTLADPRIVLVIPAQLLMIYWETYWFFHGLLTKPHP